MDRRPRALRTAAAAAAPASPDEAARASFCPTQGSAARASKVSQKQYAVLTSDVVTLFYLHLLKVWFSNSTRQDEMVYQTLDKRVIKFSWNKPPVRKAQRTPL